MPTEILIFSRKHGRALKTYGVNRPDYIMKFTFICIVVILSCGWCASGDLEIYPRLRFNFNDNRKFRLKKYEQPDFYSKYRFPFPLEEFKDSGNLYNADAENLAERLNQLKQFEEVIDFERVHLMQQNHRNNPEHRQLKHRLEANLPKPSNLLEEARVYAQDDDFKFIVDDNDEGNEGNAPDIIGQPKYSDEDTDRDPTSEREQFLENANTESEGHHEMEESDDEDDDDEATRRFQGIKVMADPSDFAYAPSDPRFYRKTIEEGTEKAETLEPPNIDKPERSPDGSVSVSYRSEQKHPQVTREKTFSEKDTTEVAHRFGDAEVVAVKPSIGNMDSAGVYVIAIVAGISAAATVGLIAVGIGWYNLQKHMKNASDVEYPAYGITGPNKDISPSGDRRLAQSAQMYHYQHQKQQIIAMESAQPSFAISRAQPGERHGSVSEADSDEENEEGDYTVYECPGLAPTGEMEVKNPLFQDDPTPAQTPAVKNASDEKK